MEVPKHEKSPIKSLYNEIKNIVHDSFIPPMLSIL